MPAFGMCTSGSLGMLSAPQGGCSSISLAACGNQTGTKSLLALASAAGKGGSINMTTCWYGYNNTLSITPTSIVSIPAGGTTCYITSCAPAFNTACACTTCTWLTPDSPITPAPAGNSHAIVIASNSGAARSGTVCYPNVVGNFCPIITLCQLAGGGSGHQVYWVQEACSCNSTCECCCGRICYTAAPMGSSDCYGLTISWEMCKSSTLAPNTQCYSILCNGVIKGTCTIGGKLAVCCSGSLSQFMVCCADLIEAITKAEVSLTSNSSYACVTISNVAHCVGTYTIGSPNIQCVTAGAIV